MGSDFEYEFVPHLDSGGNDIGRLGAGMSIEEMKELADATPDCVGFNSNGWFKHTLLPRDRWGRWTSDPNLGFYVKLAPATLDVPQADVTGIRSSAETLLAVGTSLGTGYTSDPPVELVAQPLSELIAAGSMPQYDLYTRLLGAVSDGQLTMNAELLGPDYAVVGQVANSLLDVFVPIRNVNIEFAKGQPGMVGAPGAEVKSTPDQDGNLATPEDHAVKVSGDVNILGTTGAKLQYADFFQYKGKAHAAVKFVFANPLGIGTFLPGVPLIGGLQLSGPTIIVATASTLYDPTLDSGINEGFNFFGNLLIAESNDEALRFIGGMFGVQELAVHAAVDTSKTTPEYILEAAVQRDIPIVDGADFKLRFTRSDIGIAIKGKPPEPSVAMSNDLVVTLRAGDEDTHLVFTGGVKLEPESITAMFTMNGTGRSPEGALSGSVHNTGEWREPFGIPGVVIRQMAAQLGFTYAPPWIDNVGVHGNLRIGDVDGSISVLVDSNDADNFVLAGSVERITMLEMMSAVSPKTFLAYQAVPGDLRSTFDEIVAVAVENAKVSIVPSATSIGGVHFRDEGFTVMGTLVAWGWRASLFVNADPFDGLSVRGDMDPLDILGILKVTGAAGQPAPRLRLKLSPSAAPELHISGKVALLGLEQEVLIEAKQSGLQFAFNQDVPGILTTALGVALADGRFGATGSIRFNLNLTAPTPFGNVKLVNVGFAADAVIDAGRDVGFLGSIGGSFRFYGSKVNFGTLQIRAAPKDFRALYDLVVMRIRDDAEALFGPIFGTLSQWADAVKDGAIAFAGEVAVVAKNVYRASAAAAADAYRSLGKTATDAAKGLKSAYGLGARGAAKALKEAEYAAGEVANALDDAYGASAKVAADAMKYAGYGVDEVGKSLRTVYNASAQGVADALQHAGYAVDETGAFLRETYNYGADTLNSVLTGAGYAASEVEGFFDTLGGAFASFFDPDDTPLNPSNW